MRLKNTIPSYKIASSCAVVGILNEAGDRFSGSEAIKAIEVMRERSNGLGGGFAAYGIYPEYKDFYAFHVMYEDRQAAQLTEEYLEDNFHIEHREVIPHRHDTVIKAHPLLRRYFLKPREIKENTPDRVFERLSNDDLVLKAVMKINSGFDGAFVFSSGKNMGIFKGVGYPEDIGRFFKLDEYKAYLWTAHGRFPTNSVSWWGGAHPFGLLSWSVVHNGEISSYGINKRYLENFDYKCSLFTDTGSVLVLTTIQPALNDQRIVVVAHLFDLLIRKQGLSFEMVAKILAAPFWEEIERMPAEEKQLYTGLRIYYGSALINGPFSVIVGFEGDMAGLNDRIKLRQLVAARKGDFLYLASEECAIREICPFPEISWSPRGGELVIGRVKNGK